MRICTYGIITTYAPIAAQEASTTHHCDGLYLPYRPIEWALAHDIGACPWAIDNGQ